jgi:hypothetical protein
VVRGFFAPALNFERHFHLSEALYARMAWNRLIRFEDDSGRQRFGQPEINDVAQFYDLLQAGSLFTRVLEGDDIFALRDSEQRLKVKRVLPILTRDDVPLIKCIGLNCE